MSELGPLCAQERTSQKGEAFSASHRRQIDVLRGETVPALEKRFPNYNLV
jgi:hypothetical protein